MQSQLSGLEPTASVLKIRENFEGISMEEN